MTSIMLEHRFATTSAEGRFLSSFVESFEIENDSVKVHLKKPEDIQYYEGIKDWYFQFMKYFKFIVVREEGNFNIKINLNKDEIRSKYDAQDVRKLLETIRCGWSE